MPHLFLRSDPVIARQTFRLFLTEVFKDKRAAWTYLTLLPLNRVLYIVILPLIFSLILQSLITQPHNWVEPVLLIGLGIVIALIVIWTSWRGFNVLFDHEERMSTNLMNMAMKKLLGHSDQFFSNNKVGALANDVNLFSRSIVSLLDVTFMTATGIVANFVFSLIIIGIMSPILLIPLGLVTVFLTWHSINSIIKRGHLRKERKDRTSALTGTIADILGNHQIVRFFSGSKIELGKVNDERDAIERVTNREIEIIQRDTVLRQSVVFGMQLATIAVAVVLFTQDMVTIAALIFAVTYMGRLTGSLFEIGGVIRTVEQLFLDASKIVVILNQPTEVVDEPSAKKLKVTKGEIEFKDINFAYSDSKGSHVINNLNLTIPAGQRVGLVGHSGGGKTTLAKLVMRFADLDSGAIFIDGQSIASVTQDSLRNNIAFVPQEAFLFHRSLRENVRYGQRKANDDEVWEALKKANAYEFTSELPEGINTVVGERGVKLSGGQRQRIAIARAILKDAPILILDEATSALDSQSEKLIQEAFKKLMKGRTSLVIAHRLSTIASLDRILVLENGQIIEDGTHEELLKIADGTYAKLWAHQSGGFIQ